MATLDELAVKIIKEQELVIGPMAWAEASKVSGIAIDNNSHSVNIGDMGKAAIDQLVSRYERLFGRAAHEVCRDAVKSLIATMSPADVPASLQ